MASQLLQQYVKLTEFLGHTLGPDYEVALHDLTDRNRSIVAIANSHVSGRKLGAPLTNTALKILRDKSYESQDYLLHYRGVSADGRILRSSTFFIKQNGKLIGMLCINFDDSRYHAVSEEILRLCHPDKFVDTNFQVDTSRIDELSAIPAPPPERFHSSSGSVAEEAVYRALWVSVRPGTGVEDLAVLAQSIDGLLEVNGDLAIAQALQPILGGEIDSSVYMVYRGEMPPADPAVRLGTREEVFDLLQRGHPYFRAHHADFAPWAEEMARKQELGLAELFVMEAEGQLVGTGSIGAEDDECGVITSVSVVPEFRRRGYGGRITSAVTRRILEKGKTPRMNAGYEEVVRLYRSLGFADCGNWGCLYLKGLPV